VVLDGDVLRSLDDLQDLAPLHLPPALTIASAVCERRSATPAVACFDTAFHSTMPLEATTYPLPAEWRDGLGVRKYGFHGLSHAYSASRVASLIGVPASELHVVACHLGAGASACAISGGRSVDTTMGFTPVDGLVMATRSGSVDPGLITWLAHTKGVAVEELDDVLTHRSGLVALAGTGDMKTIIERASAGDGACRLALDVYVHRLVALVASMVASMGAVDALVFTGGVGERAVEVRRRAGSRLAFLGIALDDAANDAAHEDAEITGADASVRTFVITAREDLTIAHEVRAVLD
jgi:acetate kinase